LGDGGISERQIVITLHHEDDREYGEYVTELINNLFKVPVNIYCRQEYSINTYVVSRTKLVRFCVKELGFKVGGKVRQQVDIPDWVKQDDKYKIACLRGLFDTDGCVFNECHLIRGTKYCYPRLCFVNHSKPLVISVFDFLQSLGFNPKIRKEGRKVQLEKKDEIIKYFEIIKSNNPKHVGRFKRFFGGVG